MIHSLNLGDGRQRQSSTFVYFLYSTAAAAMNCLLFVVAILPAPLLPRCLSKCSQKLWACGDGAQDVGCRVQDVQLRVKSSGLTIMHKEGIAIVTYLCMLAMSLLCNIMSAQISVYVETPQTQNPKPHIPNRKP